MSTHTAPATADHLAAVYLVVGPLYRGAQRLVESAPDAGAVPMGVRAVLDQLHRDGPLTVPAMARAQDLSRQYVQRMVDRALTDGFVEKRPNPRHQRSDLIALTPEGRDAIGGVLEREHRQLTAAAKGLSAEDVQTCRRVLEHMLQRIPAAGDHG